MTKRKKEIERVDKHLRINIKTKDMHNDICINVNNYY